MKYFIYILVFVLSGINIYAQSPSKVIAEVSGGAESTVKNSPFSADAVSESVQILADGNRIVHSTTSKMFRSSEGRFRREINTSSGSMYGSFYSFGPGVTILDPVGSQRFVLNIDDKTARVIRLGHGREFAIARVSRMSDNERKAYELDAAKMKDRKAGMSDNQRKAYEIDVAKMNQRNSSDRASSETAIVLNKRQSVDGAPLPTVVTGSASESITVGRMRDGEGMSAYGHGRDSRWETRTEDLGTRDIEGVSASGTKKITTIPAGEIGNERPIEITYERWYSKDLELVVYSKRSDPRFGDQTYKLTNIVRSEPDPSLFSIPPGFKVLSEPASVYRLRSGMAVPATAAPRAVTVAEPVTEPVNPS